MWLNSCHLNSNFLEKSDVNTSPSSPLPPPQKHQIVESQIEPGPYCFRSQEAPISSTAELLVAYDYTVTGTIVGAVSKPAPNSPPTYRQFFAGVLEAEKLQVNLTTEIDDRQQESQETWLLTRKLLQTKTTIYYPIDCQTLISHPD